MMNLSVETIEEFINIYNETDEQASPTERAEEIRSFIIVNKAIKDADNLVELIMLKGYKEIKLMLEDIFKADDMSVFDSKRLSDNLNIKYLEDSYILGDKIVAIEEYGLSFDEFIKSIC